MRTGRPLVRPQLEGLEERTLLSANAYVVNVLGDNGGPQGAQSGQFSGNLRWCINQADLPANNGSTITFDQTVFDPSQKTTISLVNGELPISSNMTITNAGGPSSIFVSGTAGVVASNGQLNASRVFEIIGNNANPSNVTTVTIAGLTISDGNASVGYTSLAGNQGGDIFNGGNLTLTNDVVQNGNSLGVIGGPAGRGGGIFNAEGQNGVPSATLTLNNTTVENNVALGNSGAGDGGGIYNDINATVIVQSGSQLVANSALGSGTGGPAAGGGIYNRGVLQLNPGSPGSPLVIEDNVAKGGAGFPGGGASGGGVFNSGTMTLQMVNFLGNQALGGVGLPGPGNSRGGDGGAAQGGAIYNKGGDSLVLQNVVFGVDSKPTNPNGVIDPGTGNLKATGDVAMGGVGGKGGDGFARGMSGGDGGIGGNAQGGAVDSTSGGLTFTNSTTNTTFTSSLAQGGDGGAGGAGYPGYLPTPGTGTPGGNGGNGGNAGDALGGAVANFVGPLSFAGNPFVANVAQGGHGGVGGNGAGGDTGVVGSLGPGGNGGNGGNGGIGGGAQGGGFYNYNAALTITGTNFTQGNDAVGGDGGSGGNGGNGGQGGDNGSGLASIGGSGGTGGNGGDTRQASGGAGEIINGNSQISAVVTSSLAQSGNGGQGGNGGNGGNSGNGNVFPNNGHYGGAGGDGGHGGSAGPVLGGAFAFSASNVNLTNSTFGGSQANLADNVIGGSGGNGGTGGNIGMFGHITNDYVIWYTPGSPEGTLNPAGNGGNGGTGASVSGGAVSMTANPVGAVGVLGKTTGLNFGQSGGFALADATGAAGPTNSGASSYVEATNQTIAVFSPNTVTSPTVTDSLADFFTNVGKLARADGSSQFTTPSIVWDEQIQRFIVVDQDVDGFFNNGNATLHKSYLDIAVSTSANPTTLSASDWSFYQLSTTENQSGVPFDPQLTGNIGWSHDALVVSFNMYNQSGAEDHVMVNTISMSALTTPGTTLAVGANAFQFDYAGEGLQPVVMHDSKAGDPVWLIQAGSDNASLNVVELANPLSTSGTLATTKVAVKPYSPAVSMIQPNGQSFGPISSDIAKAAEQNGLLVAAQTVSDSIGDSDSIQWYVVDLSSGSPVLQQQGDIGSGAGVYDALPSIDINANSDLGMTFVQSGLAAGQFPSMYVTGRARNDANGTMRLPVLVQAGLQNYGGAQFGGTSALNVDSDNTFWAVNQYADKEAGNNWSTEIAHFAVTPAINISRVTFTGTSLVAGNGGNGGQAGLGSDDAKNRGINGLGADGGNAQGGTVFMSAKSAQAAALSTVSISNSTAKAGNGGNGAINNVSGDVVNVWWKPQYGSNPHVNNFPGRLAGLNGKGSNGGNGGSVQGVGIASVDYALNLSDTTLDTGTGTAGTGGTGGGTTLNLPSSWDGGNGGKGGSVQGGGVFLSNNVKSPVPLSFTFNGGSASNYTLAGGVGGSGGNAGASTTAARKSNVAGGVGGIGGAAQGGGIYVFASSKSVNVTAFSNVAIQNDQISAGGGGQGGAGYLANGGLGGYAQGGGVFSSSINTSANQNSSFSITASTLAGDGAAGGNGGNAGSATTPNGGQGGVGGNAGNADGGALYNGQNTPLNIVNSTFGGGSASSNANANANILISGLGGRGGNAGTPAGVTKNNGGNGGNGGSVHGGNVYNASTGAVFLDDTIVAGQASVYGLGGVGGSGAGSGGSPGNPGNIGAGIAGGYFATANSSNTLGNSILAFNTAASDPDAFGVFTTAGNNILSNLTGASGFNTGSGGTDQLVTTGYSANLGPLEDNGGSTWTDAVLPGSAAVSAGNVNSIPAGITTDQRGAGFPRTFNNTLSNGAFQYLPPVINTLSPGSVFQNSPPITLTVNGTNFAANATVSFGGTLLKPLAGSTSTQLKVIVPASLLTTPGAVAVKVNIPDGSGISGQTESSTPVNFNVLPTPFTLVNPGTQQGYIGAVVSLQVKPAAGFNANSFSAVGLPNGLSINQDTGIISGTIGGNPTTYNVTVSAFDNNGDPASVQFNWTVGPALVLNNPGNQTGNEGDSVKLLISAPPGYTPSGFTATGLPPGLSINTTTGLISGTIDPRGEGSYQVTVTPTNNNNQGGVTFTWTVNDFTPPVLVNPGTQNSAAGQNIDLPIKASDADSGSFTATGLPPGLLIDANGVIFGTIASNAQGSYAVKIQAADGSIQSAPITFLWFVNGTVSPPAATPPVSPPGVAAPGANVATSVTIANVTNQYLGLVQVETVTVDVSSVNGLPINEGVVAIQVDGQTAFAAVHNGVATASFATGLLDFNLLTDLLYAHPLSVSYSDGISAFASSGSSITLPAIWIDYLISLLAADIGQLV